MAIQLVEQGSAASFRNVINSNFSELQVLVGEVPPTTSTKGAVGQQYLDTRTQRSYYCANVIGFTYIWKPYSSESIIVSESQPANQLKGDLWFNIVK